MRCVDLNLAIFRFFLRFKGNFHMKHLQLLKNPKESRGLEVRCFLTTFPHTANFLETSELHGFDTHKLLQPIHESLYIYIYMRKEHGESKCSHHERIVWNLNIITCFKNFLASDIQKLESIRPENIRMLKHNDRWGKTLASHVDFPEVRLKEMLQKPLPLEKLCKLTEVDDEWKKTNQTQNREGKLWWLMDSWIFLVHF